MDNTLVLSDHVKRVFVCGNTFSPHIRGDNLRQGVHPWCCSIENNLKEAKFGYMTNCFCIPDMGCTKNIGVKHDSW